MGRQTAKGTSSRTSHHETKGYIGRNIVFIVGCPRSGTTWLQKLLASHPKVKTGQETDIFDGYLGPQLRYWNQNLYHDRSGRGGVGLACYYTEEDFLEKLKAYCLSLLEPMIGDLKEGELFVEKTPSHALYIAEIKKLLPRARIIHILRDPRDVVASLLAAYRGWGRKWAPKTARRAARMWLQHVQAVRDSSHLFSQKQFFEVKYEELNVEPVKRLYQLIDFLGLTWSREEIRNAIKKNQRGREGTKIPLGGEFARRSGKVVSEPQGFIRKATPGRWEKDLSIIEKLWIYRIAGKKMFELGYMGKENLQVTRAGYPKKR